MIDIIQKLETESLTIFEWFENNSKLIVENIRGNLICCETSVKLSGMTVGSKISFEPHLNTAC